MSYWAHRVKHTKLPGYTDYSFDLRVRSYINLVYTREILNICIRWGVSSLPKSFFIVF